MGSRYGILNRDEIFDALQRRWEYFRSTSDQATRVWKSAVGHNLSVKQCFVRVHVEGKKNISYYIVDTAVDPAEGRLSKAKNSTGATDRMSIPIITRKLVLPSNFDLSIQARWSPAIAAIRNAKLGYPSTNQVRARQSSSSSKSLEDRQSESDSSTDSETESDDTTTETEPVTTPNARSGSRLGSSLSAIIESSSTRRQPPLPRLAFSRSLSNALVAAPPPSRRRNLSARNSTSTGKQTLLIRPPSSRSPLPTRPSTQSSSLLPELPLSNPRSASPPGSSSDFSSLQDHVNAALADVAACLPEIADHCPQPDEPAAERDAAAGPSMMIDIHSSILDPLPEIDLEAILKEAQLEIQEEKQATAFESQQQLGLASQAEDEDSLVPTAADFDRLLASVISEHGDTPPNDQQALELELESTLVNTRSKRSTDEAGLNDLLQDLIDEAQHQTAQEAVPQTVEEEEESVAFMEASRILEAEIEEALKRAEEQEMMRAAELERETEAARQRTLSREMGERLNMQLTASGDIPVHPASGDIPVHPLPAAEPCLTPIGSSSAAAPSRPRTAPRTRADRRAQTRPTSGPRPIRPPAIRPTLLRCLPNPPTSSPTTTQSTLIDRRTRASGARTVGRKLNLPLPSSHTLPPLDSPDPPQSPSTALHHHHNSSSLIDESTLAPGFLDSIPVVCSDKPRATFPELAKEAILAHPSGKLTAAEIFKVLEKKYPYFVAAAESWKATLRNVLTSHSCFVKIPRPPDAPGRGDWWATVNLPLWKRRRTTAKAKQDEDFVGRHAREHSSRQSNSVGTARAATGEAVRSGGIGEALASRTSSNTHAPAPTLVQDNHGHSRLDQLDLAVTIDLGSGNHNQQLDSLLIEPLLLDPFFPQQQQQQQQQLQINVIST